MILIHNTSSLYENKNESMEFYTELINEGFFNKAGSFLKKILNWIKRMVNVVIAHIIVGIKNLMYHLRLTDYKSVVLYTNIFSSSDSDEEAIEVKSGDEIIEVLEQIIQNGDDTTELQNTIATCEKATKLFKNIKPEVYIHNTKNSATMKKTDAEALLDGSDRKIKVLKSYLTELQKYINSKEESLEKHNIKPLVTKLLTSYSALINEAVKYVNSTRKAIEKILHALTSSRGYKKDGVKINK